MTRWLVTGARGMLGRDLVTTVAGPGHEVAGPDRAELDITDAAAVRRALLRWRPAVVVNCAAWTAVDDAEGSETRSGSTGRPWPGSPPSAPRGAAR